jgi:phosphonopyruvate decarboxylase
VTGAAFAALLERHGIGFAAGVPCSLVEGLLATLQTQARVPYLAAVREDVAVGAAAGAWLGGRQPAVLMQNSGLGTSLNALASLSLLYGLPVLLLVTWRGYGGRDAPEHILMGEITTPVLDLLGIPYRVMTADAAAADVAWAVREMNARLRPVALLIPPGVLSPGGPSEARALPPLPAGGAVGRASVEALRPVLSRQAAIAAAVKTLGAEAVVHANGYPSRESAAVADRPQNFYMIGSMGLAASIGLGLALARPRRRVVVFDGDGNLLMNLGVLANVAAAAPANFVHCVFDNEAYGSTGGQASASRQVRLDRVAAAAGYRTVLAVTQAEEIEGALRAMLAVDGPHFLLVKVTPEEADVPRITLTPEAIRDRFRGAMLAP